MTLLVAKLLGLMGGCLQLLPTLESLNLSVRANPSPAFKALLSLHPANLFLLVSPYFFGDNYIYGDGNGHEFGLSDGVVATV